MFYEYASRKAKHVMQLNAMVEAEDVEFEDYEEEEMEADEETVVVWIYFSATAILKRVLFRTTIKS